MHYHALGTLASLHNFNNNWVDKVLQVQKLLTGMGAAGLGNACLAQLRRCGLHHAAAGGRQLNKGLGRRSKTVIKGNKERRTRQPNDGTHLFVAFLTCDQSLTSGTPLLEPISCPSICLSVWPAVYQSLWRQNTPA